MYIASWHYTFDTNAYVQINEFAKLTIVESIFFF